MIERADARRQPADAMIWIDHQQAIIATQHRDGTPFVERLGRGAFEPESAFAARAVDEVMDSAIVTVAGPAFARTSFERALVAVTHRPDGIIDVEPWMDSADVADFPPRRRDR